VLAETWHEWRLVAWPTPRAVAYNTAVVAGATVALVAVVSLWEFGARAITTAIFG